MVAGSRSSLIRCSTARLASSTATPVCLSAPAPETKTRWGAPVPDSASARFRPWRSSPPGPTRCALPLANTAFMPRAAAARLPASSKSARTTWAPSAASRAASEPPGRPRHQDPPGAGTRYPVVIVRETHKENLSGLRTTLTRPPPVPVVMPLNAALTGALHERLPGAGFPDIRPPHCQVLRGIEPGGSRLTDLAAAARMTKQSMGALVDHLEAAGYV